MEEVKNTLISIRDKYSKETNYTSLRDLRKQIYCLECDLVKLCITHNEFKINIDGFLDYVNEDDNGNCKICGLSTKFKLKKLK